MEGIHSGMEPGVRDLIIAWRIQISSISTQAGGSPIDDSDSGSASDSDLPGPIPESILSDLEKAGI